MSPSTRERRSCHSRVYRAYVLPPAGGSGKKRVKSRDTRRPTQMPKTNKQFAPLTLGSLASKYLILNPGGDVERDIDECTDATPGQHRFICAQTCLVWQSPAPLPRLAARPTSSRVCPDPARNPPFNWRGAVTQARHPKLKSVLPETIRHDEVLFLHLYCVYELKDGIESISLVRQDETNEEILSPQMKKLWGKIDRSKFTNPIYAPTPRYLGKQAEVEMEKQLCLMYNDKLTPEGWLALGAHFGNIVSPSLSEIKLNVWEMMREPAHFPFPCTRCLRRNCAPRLRRG